jgi:hypothetical protein
LSKLEDILDADMFSLDLPTAASNVEYLRPITELDVSDQYLEDLLQTAAELDYSSFSCVLLTSSS